MNDFTLSMRVAGSGDEDESDIEYRCPNKNEKYTVAESVPDWIAPLFCDAPELLNLLECYVASDVGKDDALLRLSRAAIKKAHRARRTRRA